MSTRSAPAWLFVSLLCAAGIPLLYALMNDAWIYSGFDYADAQINVSLSRRFFEQAYRIEPYHIYKTSRVPLILVQAVVRWALSPVAAQFLLAIGPIVAIGLLLWRIVARALGRTTAAFVTSLTLASSCLFVLRYTGGTDYMNLIGAAVALAAVERFMRALERPSQRSWLVFGALLATALYTHPLTATLLGLFCAVELAASCSAFRGGAIARAGGATVVGGLAASLGLAGVCALAGKDALFFRPQIDQLIEAWGRRDQDLPDPAGLGELLARPGYEHLGVVAAVLIVAVALIAFEAYRATGEKAWRRRMLRRPLLYLLQFVLVCGLFLWQEGRGGILLDVVHHSHPLLLSMGLALGGIHRQYWTAPDNPRTALVAWGAVVAGATLDLVFPHSTWDDSLRGTLIVGSVVLAGLIAWAAVGRYRPAPALAILALGCAWATSASGELLRYDPHGFNEAIFRADRQLWSQLQGEGPAVSDHLYSYSGSGLVNVLLSPDHHPRRAALASLVDWSLPGRMPEPESRRTAMSAARFGNSLHYSIGMRFLGLVGVRSDPAPHPEPPSEFVFYQPPPRLLQNRFQQARFVLEPDAAVLVFGMDERELQQLLDVLAARGRPMVPRRAIHLQTRPFTLDGFLLVPAQPS